MAGEVHLEMCIKDLRERFARIDLQVSAPLVAFRESVFHPPESPDLSLDPPKVQELSATLCLPSSILQVASNGSWQVVEGTTANGRCSVRVCAHSLPGSVAAALDENGGLLRRVLADASLRSNAGGGEAALDTAAVTAENGARAPPLAIDIVHTPHFALLLIRRQQQWEEHGHA